MITDQSVIRDLPGAYEVAGCGEDRQPLTEWVSLAPRTLFDDPIRAVAGVIVEGRVTGVVGRDGRYRRIFRYGIHVALGDSVRLSAGDVTGADGL